MPKSSNYVAKKVMLRRPTGMSAAMSGVVGRAAYWRTEPRAMLIRADGKRTVLA